MEIIVLVKLKVIWVLKVGFEGAILSSWGICECLEIINLF